MNGTSQQLKGIAVTAGLGFILVVMVGLFWFDPAQHAIFPLCPFHQITGLNCPGCGGLRALHHLAHGRVLTAFHHNPLLVVALPLVLLAATRWLIQTRKFQTACESPTDRDRRREETHGTSVAENQPPLIAGGEGFEKIWRPRLFVALIVVVILFGVLRNLPFAAFAWMSP